MRVCFLLPDLNLSGGVGVVVRHAFWVQRRHADFEVTILLTGNEPERSPLYRPLLDELDVRPLRDVHANERFDVAIATWWQTAYRLFEIEASRYAYFVQSLEDRFYHGEDPIERGAVAITYDLPVSFITEARWIADFLGALRPDTDCHVVPNGIDKDVFRPAAEAGAGDPERLRVVIEGNPDHWLKAVPDALAALELTRRPMQTTLVSPRALGDRKFPVDRALGPVSEAELARLYADGDVVLKLSRVEGMFGPPLEGFHMGATCVVSPVTGHEEYVRHAHNGIVCDFDDLAGVARWLDLLEADRDFLAKLRANALATARAWPSWEQAADRMVGALRAIAASEPRSPYAGARELLRHTWSAQHDARAQLYQLTSVTTRWERFEKTRAYRAAVGLQAARRRATPWRRS